MPGVSNFQEVNVRTYVFDENGTPGVWFYSLDADCWPGVQWGRRLFGLPYHWTRMRFSRDDSTGRIDYQLHRRGAGAAPASRFTLHPLRF